MDTLVLGLGKSGIAVVQLLLLKGNKVLGFDDKISSDHEKIKPLIQSGMRLLEPNHPIDWKTISRLIVSPGVPNNHPMHQAALRNKIEVLGEMECALRFLNQPMIAITGTNGKTTVTLLTEHVLKHAGIQARALGNVGVPLSQYVRACMPEEVLVIELSSYQIETLSSKAFHVAVILNITPDHLDRYPSMESYAQAKCNLQYCLKANALFYVQHEVAQKYGHLLIHPFSIFDNLQDADTHPLIGLELSAHDRENMLAAWALCRPFGVTVEQFRNSLQSFKKPPHRIEFVCEIDGICYYDDSKGTNTDAVVHAVNSMPGPVILIAGGVDKGGSYSSWALSFKQIVRKMIVFGEAAQKMCRELSPFFNVECVDSLAAAVDKAHTQAKRGDVVLLSPGCASYDMFRDYAHRGEEFQRYVHRLYTK